MKVNWLANIFIIKRMNAIFKHTNEPYLFHQRTLVLSTFCIGLTVILFSRLVYLQVLHYSFYQQLAQQNYENFALLPSIRGLIFDRNGILLAENKAQHNLVLLQSHRKQLPELVERLNQLLPIERCFLNKESKTKSYFDPIVLKKQLTETEVARFEMQRYRFPGVEVQTNWVRHYPLGKVFSSVIGYMGHMTPEEKFKLSAHNNKRTKVGKAGVEQYYESRLCGQYGYQKLTKNVQQKMFQITTQFSSVTGENLYLTLDAKLQRFVQTSLANRKGSIVVMNPNNGEILALVNHPCFDSNNFSYLLNTKPSSRKNSTIEKHSLYNRALRGHYPPGSILKPFLGLGALQKKLIRPTDSIYDSGRFQLNEQSKVYRNIYNLAWGNTSLYKAITVSSDIFFYQLSLKMGIERIAMVLKQFGYSQLTGIDLPGESAGFIPTRRWKEETFGENWYLGDTLNIGIGQGFVSVTPLQMAVATSILSMSGRHWKPHVLLGAQTPYGHILMEKPKAQQPVEGSPHQWELIKEAMAAVVSEGSAKLPFQNVSYSVGAKTGTAQVFSLKPDQLYDPELIEDNLRDHSLFIAFAPLEKPEIVLAIVLENSKVPAGYVARRILDYYFKQKLTV